VFLRLELNITTCNLKETKKKKTKSCSVGCAEIKIRCLVYFLRDKLFPFRFLTENRTPNNYNQKKMGMIIIDIEHCSCMKMLRYIMKNITFNIIINFSLCCSVGCASKQIGVLFSKRQRC